MSETAELTARQRELVDLTVELMETPEVRRSLRGEGLPVKARAAKIIELGLYDAADRARLWGEFAAEFAALASLAGVFRGPPILTGLALQAATACLQVMKEETEKAARSADCLNRLGPTR